MRLRELEKKSIVTAIKAVDPEAKMKQVLAELEKGSVGSIMSYAKKYYGPHL